MGTDSPRRQIRKFVALWFSGAALTVLALAAAPASGAVVTFGADLNGLADFTETCGNAANWSPSASYSSCTLYSVAATSPTFYPPASGTVTGVRVKTGSSAGPMEVVVLYTLRQNNIPNGNPNQPPIAIAGPYVASVPPAPVATMPLSTNPTVTSLPVIEQAPPPPGDYSSVTRNDFLAISVLDPNTAIPATSDQGSTLLGFAPAPGRGSPTSSFVANSGTNPYHIALSADLDTGGGAAPGGAAPGGAAPGGPKPAAPAPPTAGLTIDPTGGQLVGNSASIPLTCALTTACNGTLTLRPPGAQAAAKKKKKKKAKLYGSTHFSIPAGGKRAVRVKLNRAARKKLRGHKSLRVSVSATGGPKVVSATLTLKRAKKK